MCNKIEKLFVSDLERCLAVRYVGNDHRSLEGFIDRSVWYLFWTKEPASVFFFFFFFFFFAAHMVFFFFLKKIDFLFGFIFFVCVFFCGEGGGFFFFFFFFFFAWRPKRIILYGQKKSIIHCGVMIR